MIPESIWKEEIAICCSWDNADATITASDGSSAAGQIITACLSNNALHLKLHYSQ